MKKLTTAFGAPSTTIRTSQRPAHGVRRCSRTSGFLRRWRTSDREVIPERVCMPRARELSHLHGYP